MHAPRSARDRCAAWLAAVLLSLVGAGTARATLSPWTLQMWKKPPSADTVRVATKYPPAESPPPLVVKPPELLQERPKTPPDNPPGNTTPEPGSLASGLIGTGLAVAAWWRKRRRGAAGQAEEAGEDEPEAAALISQAA